MARARGPRKQDQFVRFLPAVGTPGRRSIHGPSASPDGSSLTKNTAGSKARLSAIWLRKGNKALYRATLRVYHYQDRAFPAAVQFTGFRHAPLAALKFETLIPGNALRYHYVNRVIFCATQRRGGLR
jgi:hypothetical protein